MPSMRPPPGMMPHDFDPHYFHTEADGMDNNMDFAAVLAQHNADPSAIVDGEPEEQDLEPSPQQLQIHEHPGQSASDTAAAAMAQYHTMTIPQTTEQSFMQQQSSEAPGDSRASASGDPQSAQIQRTSSFDDFDPSNPVQEGQSNPNGGQGSPNSANASLNPNGPKPAVGTDEWHKVRRDNHKEGKSALCFTALMLPLSCA